MPAYLIYNSQHWQQRAEEFRNLAESVMGSGAKDAMLRIAQHYERLAVIDRERARSDRDTTQQSERAQPSHALPWGPG